MTYFRRITQPAVTVMAGILVMWGSTSSVSAASASSLTESYKSQADCVAQLTAKDASTNLNKVRSHDLLYIAKREKELTKLAARVSKLSNDAHRQALQSQLSNTSLRLAAHKAAIQAAGTIPEIHSRSCTMFFDTRIYIFWPLKISILAKANTAIRRQAALRAQVPALLTRLEKKQQTGAYTSLKTQLATANTQIAALDTRLTAMTSGLLNLAPTDIPPEGSAAEVLSGYQKKLNDIKSDQTTTSKRLKELSLAIREATSKVETAPPDTTTPQPKPTSHPKPLKPAISHPPEVVPGKLLSPPNFSIQKKNQAGYYLLPASPGNRDYLVHTSRMPGGESTTSSPASKRYGRKDLIDVIYTASVGYHAKYSDSQLVVGDLNAPGHASHRVGVDVDIYSSDRSAALISAKGGSDARSIELAKMLFDTGKIKFIFFNDPEVIEAANAYARRKGLSGTMQRSNETHDFHFHVRING